MQADDYSIETILKEGRRFLVPLYQRKYQWGDSRLVPFWEDVEAKAVEVLEGSNKFQHYMGALILAPLTEATQIGITPRVQVVDGQQRLTTFQLFLAALREVARHHEAEHLVQHIEGYLYNQPRSKDTDPLTKFKLTPTPSDREIFHRIIEGEYSDIRLGLAKYFYGEKVPKNTPFPALRAYYLLRQWALDFVANGPSDWEPDTEDGEDGDHIDDDAAHEIMEGRIEALLRAALEQMKLVVITLDEGDDAQVIFETLNSKGEPLLAMDLVRNNIFQRAERQSLATDQLYNDLWATFDAPWWKNDAPFARPKRPRIDHFLAHVLAAETGASIAMRELYAEYRNFAVPKGKPRFPNVKDELNLLQKYAPIYRTLEGEEVENATMHWFGRKLAAWQVTTVYPIALQIAASELTQDEQHRVATLLYSYLVRRAVSGLTGKNLNKLFNAIAQHFHENGPSFGTLVTFFSTRSGESSRFPSNKEFRQAIKSKPVYVLAPGERTKDILWELELASRSKFSEKIERPEGLWTEHVLPVSWNEHWPFPEGPFVQRYSGDPRAIARNSLLHSLGNLTLMSGALNISSGNSSFTEKRSKYEQHTTLFMNKWFSKREKWDETDIHERGEYLAELALQRWSGLPDDE
ncbi:DUF262 domain-containing protein [Ensifer sp. ENS06]|uniref:DUF262 domain-containing protein n=1 Tax=Ensifer sp. ENS06 TaxID=2769276 RepID=UPI00177B0076|nr:DUF262 domain-containing protein [Ensifer sp. ENS06]MBD9627553.1 DUF262 domain-containing protein [Ensifer sp. ENS06]